MAPSAGPGAPGPRSDADGSLADAKVALSEVTPPTRTVPGSSRHRARTAPAMTTTRARKTVRRNRRSWRRWRRTQSGTDRVTVWPSSGSARPFPRWARERGGSSVVMISGRQQVPAPRGRLFRFRPGHGHLGRPPRVSCARVGLLVHPPQPVDGDVSVELSGRQAGVAEQLLNHPKIGTTLEQV